ncbi:MAG: RteC domain-containing protein [Cellulophaga sp.]|nr:RteC domain-containing protein [Cellulophaga sp.]
MKFDQLILDFETKLKTLEAGHEHILFKAEKGIAQSEKSIKRLRIRVLEKGFFSQAEEILFFKHIKPQFFSKLIYYVKLYNIESKRPKSDAKYQIKYLNHQIHKLQVYFNENLDFYYYYRRGATTLDELYFIRGKSNLRTPTQSFHFFADDEFSTFQDSSVSTIIAFDMLIDYLQQEIEKLENQEKKTKSGTIKKTPKVFWTGNKTELIELIYALQSSGNINSGTADIKEMANLFEQIFQLDLGNYYHTFAEIRARKSSKTKFLDRLKEVLNHRFHQLDE